MKKYTCYVLNINYNKINDYILFKKDFHDTTGYAFNLHEPIDNQNLAVIDNLENTP